MAMLAMVSCLAYSSILKMEATCFPETSVDFQPTTWLYIPKELFIFHLLLLLLSLSLLSTKEKLPLQEIPDPLLFSKSFPNLF
jgi:hypothetical protein